MNRRRSEETIHGVPLSAYGIPKPLLQKASTKKILHALFDPCPQVKENASWRETRRLYNVIGFQIPKNINEEQLKTITSELQQMQRNTRIQFYGALGQVELGTPGLCVAETVLAHAQENFEPREWVLLRCAQRHAPAKVLEIIYVLLAVCKLHWQSIGKLNVTMPLLFPRRTLRHAQSLLSPNDDIRKYTSSLREIGLAPLADILEKISTEHPDTHSAEVAYVDDHLDGFERLQEFPHDAVHHFRELTHKTIAHLDVEYADRSLSIEPNGRLYQREADVLIGGYKALPEEHRLAMLDTANQHELFSVVPESLEHAYLRKRDPDGEHMRETLLLVLLRKGVRSELLKGIVILAEEWKLQWNTEASKRGDTERVLTWTAPSSYSQATLRAAEVALQGIDPALLEESAPALSAPFVQQLDALINRRSFALEKKADSAQSNGEKTPEEQHMRNGTREEAFSIPPSKPVHRRRVNGHSTTSVLLHRQKLVEEVERAAEQVRREREQQLHAMAQEIQDYLYNTRRGKFFTLREAVQILEAIGLEFFRDKGKHQEGIYNPETRRKHKFPTDWTTSKKLEGAYIVDIVFGHHGQPGVGGEEKLYKWMLNQDDYRPREAKGARE
ncbi:MAG: hypothetical protein Q7R81_02205 [Candidatus Peregrinibacteria bacterium]|nr:hypothetical protein [Candidatus Peregrinibacteria bacterium]